MLKVATAMSIFLMSHVGFADEPAAKFSSITNMKSDAAKKFSTVVRDIAVDEAVFGDASSARAFSFTRKATEENLNTVKQLNFAYAGLNSDDTGAEPADDKAADFLTEHILNAITPNIEDTAAFLKARKNLIQAIEAVKEKSDLLIYITNHADEDGSWQIINLLDVENSEVLLAKIGYRGT